jgi:isoquinoline 1-oxidoreductase subunit alpha
MASLTINGRKVETVADGDTPLLWVLRDELDLTGTKFGCGVAQCGACTVHVDGQPTRSCVTPVDTVKGQSITTVEGLSGKVPDAVRAAWIKLDVAQCGYCQSGQIMAAVALLTVKPNPTDGDITDAMNGNICRCATYVRIRQAIKDASATIRA